MTWKTLESAPAADVDDDDYPLVLLWVEGGGWKGEGCQVIGYILRRSNGQLVGKPWNCGGEGRVNYCIDGCCVDTDDIYCSYCSKRCDICNPPTPKQVEEGNKLRQVLADALAQPQSKPQEGGT